MKELLDIYIRSLGEQEQAADAPERYQDLGTFVCWLLERLGYQVHLRAYRREGALHKRSSGRRQHGVDIVASKPDEDGVDRGWLFVLKQGNFGRKEFARRFEPESMLADLGEAVGRDPSDSSRQALDVRGDDRGNWERVTVVAVHNGDVDTESIGSQRKGFIQGLEKTSGIPVKWWDANELLTQALASPVNSSHGSLDEQGDASVFPPAVRPFARLALDSLHRDPARLGSTFDLDAVDRLIEQVLPLGRQLKGSGPGAALEEGAPLPARRIHRAGSELALFAGMLEVECRRLAAQNTLPVLDTIEHILVRIMEHLRRLPRGTFRDGYKRKLQFLLDTLVERYIGQARQLLAHLEPLRDVPYGLALPADGEVIDYPLRALRLGGYLAKAGLACLDRGHTQDAHVFARALEWLVVNNPGGILSPVIDDQIIELGAIWMLWLRVDMHAEVGRSARILIERLAVRNRLGMPLPALWMRATSPPAPEHVRMLVHAHALDRSADPGFQDAGTTILPLAVVLCHRTGVAIDAATWSLLRPDIPSAADPRGSDDQLQPARVIYPQSWQPPGDAADEWYAREIRFRGPTKVYELTEDPTAMVTPFERFHASSPSPSAAVAWKSSAIDWMAWSIHRTPPPMSLFLQADP